jgi:hypothetical protein
VPLGQHDILYDRNLGFLGRRLTDSGEVNSLKLLQLSPEERSDTHFSWRVSKPRGFNAAGGIR